MTWIKLNDNTNRHPKVARLGDRAFRVWIDSLLYASEFLTNGVLPMAFLVNVKQAIRDELVIARLWDVNDDASVSVHDYLEHQTSRESVEQERQRNRDRRRGSRGTPAGRTAGTTAGTTVGSTSENPRPESREQRAEVPSENRAQSSSNGHGAAIIVSPKEYARKLERCAYVGSRLEVPKGLHVDLRRDLGGQNADVDLLAWYADLDEEIERTGESILPDVFKWLRAKFTAWAVTTGHVMSTPQKTGDEIMAEAEAIQAARKARVQ